MGLKLKNKIYYHPPPEIRVSLLFFNANLKEAFSGKSHFLQINKELLILNPRTVI